MQGTRMRDWCVAVAFLTASTAGCGQEVGWLGASCTNGADCPEDMVCAMDVPGGMCTRVCNPVPGCSSGRCVPVGTTSICVPLCSPDRPCRDGWRCEDGACAPGEPIGADADADVDGGDAWPDLAPDDGDTAPDDGEATDLVDVPDEGTAVDETEVVDEGLDDGSVMDDAAGGDGDACSDGGTCRDPLLCIDGFCRPGVQARFCHCLVSGSGAYINLSLHLNEYVFPPVRTLSCSPCQTVPGGRVYLQAFFDDGSLLGAAWLNIPETASGEVTLFVTSSEFLVYEVGCMDTMSCP